MRQLSSSTNRGFALDIVLRSFYNLGQWERLVDFASFHPELESNKFVQKARAKIYLASKGVSETPLLHNTEHWKPATPLSNWYQEDSRIWFRYPDGWAFWDMPDDFELENTHPSFAHFINEYSPKTIRDSLSTRDFVISASWKQYRSFIFWRH